MTFAKHITTVLTALLGDLVNDHIYAMSAPDNFDFNSHNMIVYMYRVNENLQTLDNVSDVTDYIVSLNILSQSGLATADVGEQIISRFQFWSDGGIADVEFVDDNNDYDLDTGIYLRTINFNVIFKN